LELSPRTPNCLKRGQVTDLGQVFDMSDEELLQIRNFGEQSLEELKIQLERLIYANDEIPANN
jgi:DNA-directed RNA polymerase subunit alpha